LKLNNPHQHENTSAFELGYKKIGKRIGKSAFCFLVFLKSVETSHWDLSVSSARKNLRLRRALSAGSHEAQVKPDCRSTKRFSVASLEQV
jgi:hypothetical protein